MAQVPSTSTVHDVVVVGSGAGGGTVTKVLADLGIPVLLLEAGPMLQMTDLKEHMWPYQVPHRGAGARGQAYTGGPTGFTYSATYGGNQLEGEPYTVAPGSDFSWFRSRILGGRTNHYGRVTLRMADYDFKPKTTDGLGFDWPISYEDLAPYYDKAERLIGVTGTAEGIRSAPDGIFNPPGALKAHEVLIQRSCARLGIRAVSSRQAVTTVARNGRPPCHYCGQCGRGCMTASNYAASYVQIFPAMKTGKVQVVANAMARELITDASGKVTAVSYIDKDTGSERQVRCRTVVLAASCCESTRLLLNSKSSRHPQGLANSSGKVGRYLMDTVGFGMSAMVPALSGMPHYNTDGYGSHLYVPWWLWDKHKTLNFPRGYHIEVGGGYGMPGVGSFTGIVNRTEGYGARMKQAIRDEYGTSVGLSGRGEMIPNEDSYCEIDPEMKDKYRHPGAALPLEVERPRAEPGPPHAADLPRHPRRHGRPDRRRRTRGRPRRGHAEPAVADRSTSRRPGAADRSGRATDRPGQRTCRAADDDGTAGAGERWCADLTRRGDHSRGRHRPHGRRSEDEPAEQVLPGSRGEEPLRRRRRAIRQQRRQESHAHDRRARVAHGRVPRRRTEEGQCLTFRVATRCAGSAWC